MKKLELLSKDEFLEKHKELTGHRLLMRSIYGIKHCSANMFGGCVVGTLLIPDKAELTKHKLKCGFYMGEDMLLIIDDEAMSRHRKDLRLLAGYYKLLADVTDVMAEAMTKEQRERERQLFSFLGNKIDRLYHDALGMSEYVLQIRDIYQSKISAAQNRVIHLLTIVTAIFMPLTLIAGWYGMNFNNMPELGFRYGYMFTAILAAVIVVVEIIIFKRKKWF